MVNKYIIHKLGGAFLSSSRDQIDEAVSMILKEKNADTVIVFVVSALSKVTRILDQILIAMTERDCELIESLHSQLSDIHRFRLKDLNIICPVIEQYLHNLHTHFNKKVFSNDIKRERAYILKYGELMSSAIFTSYLISRGQNPYQKDARLFIATNDNSPYDNARIDYCLTEQGIICIFNRLKSNVFVTQGFIGRESDSGDDTVLGYDGSDLSAAVITSVLMKKAPCKLIYWKDEPGVKINFLDKTSGYFRQLSMTEIGKLKSSPVRCDTFKPFDSHSDLLKQRPEILEIRIRSFKNLYSKGTLITVG